MSDHERQDPQVVALRALGWILSDDDRAQRLLDLTGLSPETLRSSAADRATQCAVLDFLGSHEPDLLAASQELELAPESIARAREELGR